VRVTVEDATGGRVVIDGDEVAKADSEPEPWDGTSIAGLVIKAEEAQRYTLHCAYPANKCDVSVAADGYRDFISPSALEKSAWDFIKSPEVGLWHAEGTSGSGTVCESYIYRGPDWEIGTKGTYVVKAGDWMVGIIWSKETWPLVLQGKVNGVSMQGRAQRQRPSAEALRQLRP
jgi:hypothetical protein